MEQTRAAQRSKLSDRRPKRMNTTEGNNGGSLKRVVRLLACGFGFHVWQYDSDYFVGGQHCHEVWLHWRRCQHCTKCELNQIMR